MSDVELRCGDYREALRDVECVDAVICDCPYSDRVELGVRSGSTMQDQRNQIGMGYDPITETWANEFVDFWHPRCRGWMVLYGDHISTRWFEAALVRVGRYTFAPLPLVKIGAAPRMCADGPASQAEWIVAASVEDPAYAIVAARPKRADFVGSWGGLPGWYRMETVRAGHGHNGVRGAKSLQHMCDVVEDYSRPGDLIADPCSGSGTTLLAARTLGRRAIGAERDAETFAKAQARLAHFPVEARGQTALFAEGSEP